MRRDPIDIFAGEGGSEVGEGEKNVCFTQRLDEDKARGHLEADRNYAVTMCWSDIYLDICGDGHLSSFDGRLAIHKNVNDMWVLLFSYGISVTVVVS